MNRSLLLRTLTIAILALVLLVPVAMIRDLIGERQARRNEALGEIAQGWGRRQVLGGPYLAVPYDRFWTEVTSETIDGQTREKRRERMESAVIRLPLDSIDWSANAQIAEKSRGIYTARLYTTKIDAVGHIAIPARFGLKDTSSRLAWGVPRLVVGIADPRGIRSVSALEVDQAKVDFQPGAGDAALASGVHAPLPQLDMAARELRLRFSLELAGSEAFAIAPLSRDTSVALAADWPHPSFQGVFLPAKHEIRPDGFSASWRVSQFAALGAERLASCEAAKPCAAIGSQELGVSFIQPVGVYQQLERASKYGFLFIGLLFAAFFLFELLRRLQIHPIQYLLVGLALAIFFLLLTALSEHIAFGAAYAIATFGCVGLITVYLVRVLKSARVGLAFGGALSALYAVLYALLKAEDYSLLAGSVILFGLLAAVMLATRRLDWYRLGPTPARAESQERTSAGEGLYR